MPFGHAGSPHRLIKEAGVIVGKNPKHCVVVLCIMQRIEDGL